MLITTDRNDRKGTNTTNDKVRHAYVCSLSYDYLELFRRTEHDNSCSYLNVPCALSRRNDTVNSKTLRLIKKLTKRQDVIKLQTAYILHNL